MEEGYGCSNLIHTQLQAGCHCVKTEEARQIKDGTPIFNRQVTKDCTQQLGHHHACEVNGRSLTCVLYTCCMHIFL